MTRFAVAHDYLLVNRGAERTFAEIAAVWPEAPVHTLLFDPDAMDGRYADRPVHTSHLQRLGMRQATFRRLMPLFPTAIDAMKVDADVLVSSSSAFAHGLRVGKGALHVAYCHAPFRYAWYEEARALAEVGPALRPLLRAMLRRHRVWDLRAAGRITSFVANGEITRARIARFFGRDATVIHPPVAVGRFSRAEPEDFFLTVGELTGHKRTDLALEAARHSGQRMKVVGGGPDEARLRREYGDVAEFLGRVPDHELVDLLPRCRALVMPNVEEFGIAAVEAQAAGRPVLAVAGGGALETVIPHGTGCLVAPDDVSGMATAMRDFDWDGVEAADAVANAERFSTERFRRQMRDEVARVISAA